jgi:hypothetical protein
MISNSVLLKVTSKLTSKELVKPNNEVAKVRNSNSNEASLMTSSTNLPKIKIFNEEDEVTDDEDKATQLPVSEYTQIFEDNKNRILQILPNLKIGMDLSKVSNERFDMKF